ncbi:G-protein coupled receptor family C group 5 member B [Lethenteron reissneri]|uniref:G-protein coupled receptor family C group 5 member B n=1 Tax=Lethenteron reissneri TaxID=7753 RepID=UPI002AB65882|nr:G-protein coupled receptor family C group 5 member B [Lethenteron reissneri]
MRPVAPPLLLLLRLLLPVASLLCAHARAADSAPLPGNRTRLPAATGRPPPASGCADDLAGSSPRLHGLLRLACDPDSAWKSAIAVSSGVGVVFSAALLCVQTSAALCGSEAARSCSRSRRPLLALQALCALATVALFSLSIASLAPAARPLCIARRFLLGLLCALSVGCLLAHACALLRLAASRGTPSLDAGGQHRSNRRNDILHHHHHHPSRRRPCGTARLCGIALALAAVQAALGTQWVVLMTTPTTPTMTGDPCVHTNRWDVALPLFYPLALLMAADVASLLALWRVARAAPRLPRWCFTHARLLFATAALSSGMWLAWIALYERRGATVGATGGAGATGAAGVATRRAERWGRAATAAAPACQAAALLVLYLWPSLVPSTAAGVGGQLQQTFARGRTHVCGVEVRTRDNAVNSFIPTPSAHLPSPGDLTSVWLEAPGVARI